MAGTYQNAIVVDSFATIQMIMKKEPKSMYQSEMFIALDMIKAPNLETSLRNIIHPELIGEAKMMYDAVKFVNHHEKAVRFVLGNTVVCDNRDDARIVAYHLGGGRSYNAISKECTTFYKANGEICASFGSMANDQQHLDEEEYDERCKERREHKQAWIQSNDKMSQMKTELEAFDNEIRRFVLNVFIC